MRVLPADCCGKCTCDRAQGWVCSPGMGSGCCWEFWALAPADPPGSCPAEWLTCVARACHRSGERGQRLAPTPTFSIVPVATHCWARISQNMTWLHKVLYLGTKDSSGECYYIVTVCEWTVTWALTKIPTLNTIKIPMIHFVSTFTKQFTTPPLPLLLLLACSLITWDETKGSQQNRTKSNGYLFCPELTCAVLVLYPYAPASQTLSVLVYYNRINNYNSVSPLQRDSLTKKVVRKNVIQRKKNSKKIYGLDVW